MKRAFLPAIVLASALAVGGVAVAAGPPMQAPTPAKAIDAAQFYTGRWYEIARTPMKLTDGCVAGTTDFLRNAKGQLIDRDACRDGTPEGRVKTFEGPAAILNPPQNTKFKVDYKVFGPIHVPKTWWILDHGDDYGWFIVSDPSFKTLSIFTRASNPDPAEVRQLTERVVALGYDPKKLEYPTQFPPGEGALAAR